MPEPPSFIEPMLCKLVPSAPASAGWLHEVKFDGYRLQARIWRGEVRLRTRSGLDWTQKFPALTQDLKAGGRCIRGRPKSRPASSRRAIHDNEVSDWQRMLEKKREDEICRNMLAFASIGLGRG